MKRLSPVHVTIGFAALMLLIVLFEQKYGDGINEDAMVGVASTYSSLGPTVYSSMKAQQGGQHLGQQFRQYRYS